MDAEAFFDRLYRRFHVHFPCYALLADDAERFVTEPADDGTAALVLLTDDDLLRRYRDRRGVVGLPVEIPDPGHLGRLLRALPADDVTHVTFDPNPRFHRRFARADLLAVMRAAARKR
jgi:hypothetical protein